MHTLQAFYLVASFHGLLAARAPTLTGFDTLPTCRAAAEARLAGFAGWLTRNPQLQRLSDPLPPTELSSHESSRYLAGQGHSAWVVLVCKPGAQLTSPERAALETSP